MYGKKRGRSAKPSFRAQKKKKLVPEVRVPRFRVLKDPHKSTVSDEMRVKLTYFDTVTINAGIGVTGSYQFSANNLFDPNVSGVGHQPVGYDQLMAIYQEYCVVGSTINVYFHNPNNDLVCLAGVFSSRINTTSTDFREYVEGGNGVYVVLDTLYSGAGTKKVSYYLDMNEQAGHSVVSDERYCGTTGAGPTEQRFYQIVVQPFDGSSDLAAVQVNVEITFDVILRDRTKLAIS